MFASWWNKILCVLSFLMMAGCAAESRYDGSPYNNSNYAGTPKQNTSYEAPMGDAGVIEPPNTSGGVVVNPWEDPAQDNLSTFAIDVDTASYTYTRAQLNAGRRPDANAVRVEEFVNFFDYRYEAPKDKPLQVHVDGAISPFNKDNYVLRVGLQGRKMTEQERRPLHLTFLLDTSCSMSGGTRIGLVKKSLSILLDQLREGDTVAMATYAGNTTKLLEPTDATEKARIQSIIDKLGTGGGTAMGSGMQLAYEMASKAFVKGHENRVIVLSDGDANIGRVSHEEILKSIESYVAQGITMTTVGFGIGNYQDGRMEQLANKGNGNSYYIDSEEQADRVFRVKFISNMVTLARDVKVQVEFSKEYVARYRLIGYENRAIADNDFRNDKVDAGELGAGHTVTALYEIQLKQQEVQPLIQSQAPTPLITVRLRYKGPNASKDDPATEETTPVPSLLLHRPFEQTPWTLRFATAVMGFAEILRNSPYAQGWNLSQVRDIAKQATQPNEPTHTELINLIDKAESLLR